jgi:hypothetical protein
MPTEKGIKERFEHALVLIYKRAESSASVDDLKTIAAKAINGADCDCGECVWSPGKH